MNSVTVPEAWPRYAMVLLLTVILTGLTGCGSGTQSVLAPADDAVTFADGIGTDYALHSPDFVRGNEYQMSHVTLEIDQGSSHPAGSDARDISAVSAVVPAGVDITRAVLVADAVNKSGRRYRRVDECDVGERMVCRFRGKQIQNGSLEIDYKIFAPGDHEFTASIDTRESDPNPANNIRTMIFRYVASTRYLQSLLDATEPNGSVTLPSGTYMGTLHGGDRLLSVRGAEDGGTVLLSDNPAIALLESIGDGSTFSNLEFRSSGAPVLARSGFNITIRDSLIAPIEGAWHDLQQLFVNSSYRLLSSRVEGWGGKQGNCRSLLLSGPHYSGIYIRNTVFRNNSCDNLIRGYATKTPPFSTTSPMQNADPDVFILNNTFVDNQGLIRFSGNGTHVVHIKNNIFVAHQDPLVLPRANDQGGKPRFILARNLLWGGPLESLVSTAVAVGPMVWIEAPDLVTDPLFTDREGGDFSLATGSPAIDAGAAVALYPRTDPQRGVSPVRPAQVQSPAPVDGLLDGNAIMDIGAFEYIP